MSEFDWSRFRRVYFDSAPIIYQVESHPVYSPMMEPLFNSIDDGTVTGIVSGVTLAECLFHPIRSGDRQLERDYLTLMTDYPGIEFVDLDGWISDLAVRLRLKYSLDLLDAFQLATAIIARADAHERFHLPTSHRDPGRHVVQDRTRSASVDRDRCSQ